MSNDQPYNCLEARLGTDWKIFLIGTCLLIPFVRTAVPVAPTPAPLLGQLIFTVPAALDPPPQRYRYCLDVRLFGSTFGVFGSTFALFVSPFTPRRWLRLASNFGKTRFRQFPTFHFFDAEKHFHEHFLQKNLTSNQERAVLEEL